MKIVTPQIILPRLEHGCDWGSTLRVVLIRRGRRELWWYRSGKAWQNNMDGYRHVRARLILVEYNEDRKRDGVPHMTELHEGGRLSHALLSRFGNQINDFFGWGKTFLFVHPRSTLLLTPRDK